MSVVFNPSREDGLRRLKDYVPLAGGAYAKSRNFDFGPGEHRNVSMLSPYLRHRLIGEDEVVRAVLSKHRISTADKFIQEVCWRTYWKGWLEQRPQVWDDYLSGLAHAREATASDPDGAARLITALNGETGLAAERCIRDSTGSDMLHPRRIFMYDSTLGNRLSDKSAM